MARRKKGYTRRDNGLIQKQFTVDGKRYSVYGKTYRECEQKEFEARQAIFAPSEPTSASTLDAYYDEWERHRNGTVKRSTMLAQRRKYHTYISPVLGGKTLKEISRTDVFRLQRSLLYNNCMHTSTVNQVIAELNTVLNDAKYNQLIENNPCSYVRRLKRVEAEARDTTHRALNDDELRYFFKEAEGSRYYGLYLLMLYTGMRAGEACALTWEDVNFENDVLTVCKTAVRENGETWIQTPKTSRSKRLVPINEQIVETLKMQYEMLGRPKKKDWVFPDSRKQLLAAYQINASIKSVINKVNKRGEYHLEKFTSHAFRDTFATRAIELGMKPETVQGILGHKNIGITMNLYYHLNEEKKKREMNNIKITF